MQGVCSQGVRALKNTNSRTFALALGADMDLSKVDLCPVRQGTW